MIRRLLEKLLESFLSTLPIFLVVLVVFLLEKNSVGPFKSINPDYLISDSSMVAFSICALMIAIGLAIFSLGADQSMSQIGQLVGGSMMKKKNIFFIIAMTFVLGVFVTIAEPDLSVLSTQLNGIPNAAIVWTIGVGVGVFLVIGVLRIVFGKNLNILFICFYGLVFTIAYFVDKRLLPICFDSGGVTTGPVTVPFILAFGVGIAANRQGKKRGDDSFGLTALCSVGPILAVMILSKFVSPDVLEQTYILPSLSNNFGQALGEAVLFSMKEVVLAIVPIALFFLIYELLFLKLPIVKLIKIFVGLVYTFIGLVALLAAVNAGFKPVANKIGLALGAEDSFFGVALLFAALFGLFGVIAEPAVHVLARQIEDVSEGTIKKNTVLAVLAVAIGLAVVLAVLRAKYQFDIMLYLVPGYIIALLLSFIVPKIYTAIAFDSGGVASGPMTSTFVLPFCLGFAYSTIDDGSPISNGDIFSNGFGLVALVAMTPLIVLQLLGLYINVKKAIVYRMARNHIVEENDDQVIHLEWEGA